MITYLNGHILPVWRCVL